MKMNKIKRIKLNNTIINHINNVSYTITESKKRQTTVWYTSQGAPCSRHFFCNLKSLVIEQKIMYIKRKTEKENKGKNQHKISLIKNVFELHITA